nr:putative RNA-directed DNA polymerase, eukaryota, reverse transcriptase zinc-binding domain protein [Tanacetum cinerariifolium]
ILAFMMNLLTRYAQLRALLQYTLKNENFLLGFLNGLLGPIKAYACELFRDEHQALGLSTISTSWGTGLIIGPALGGYLAQPADKFPSLVSPNSLFGRFPYLLPCLFHQLCLYMHDPRKPHLHAMKRCPATRRSTFKYCVILGNNLRSWSSKRQETLSRCRAEHIEIDIHFVRDKVAAGHVRVLHVPLRSQTSILINGIPTLEFSLKRGLRQGDHLSPFLFIIVMEVLHMALNDGIASNMFHGNQNDMGNITRILNIIYIASSLKINFHKSNVFGVGVSNSEVVSMAACTSCEAGSFPFSYLGLPIGSNMSRIANWQMLIDRFKARLSGWKANLLSTGSRLTLIKSVLGSLGGLGVGSLSAFNKALLLKWR